MDIKKTLGKKVIPVTLAVLTVSSTTMPVFAANSSVDSIASVSDDYRSTDVTGNDANINQKSKSKIIEQKEDSSSTAEVFVTQATTYSVIIPKVIILNGTKMKRILAIIEQKYKEIFQAQM